MLMVMVQHKSKNLARAQATGDLKAVGGTIGMVGKTACDACCKTYRKKKDK